MSNFSVFVPADGMRDAFVAYFEGMGVIHLTPPESFVSQVSFAADASLADICVEGTEFAESILLRPGFNSGSLEVDPADEAYEVCRDGKFLGWEVVVYTTVIEDE